MKVRIVSAQAIVAVSLLVACGAVCDSGAVPRCAGRDVERLEAALGLEDRGRREGEVREVLADALTADEVERRDMMMSYVAAYSEVVDWRPYRETLLRVGNRGEVSRYGQALVDDVDFMHAERSARIAVLRQAMRDGEARFGAVRTMRRHAAIMAVAYEGLAELREEAEEKMGLVSASEARTFPLERFRVVFELYASSEAGPGALRTAARRLASMEGPAVAARAGNSVEFREAVLELAARACGRDPVRKTVRDAETCGAVTRLGWNSRVAPFQPSAGEPSASETAVAEWRKRLSAFATAETRAAPPVK